MNILQKYMDCLRLNLRMGRLALSNRWLGKRDYADSYNRVAATYDDHWLCRLRPVTDELLAELPDSIGAGDVLDLGCGTGYTTAHVEQKYPQNQIVGVDISPGMLEIAKGKCKTASLVAGDILEFMRSREGNSAALIVSGWAIGYSNPAELAAEAARVLKPGGSFAFVVNYADTLAPVFYAFRKCMNDFPDKINMALWPRFPKNAESLLKPLRSNGFKAVCRKDGHIPIERTDESRPTLEWLLKTGVLAGFDAVMPLHDDPVLTEKFNQELEKISTPVEHHYFSGIFSK
jgi:SAM-dependent methyltransferase